MSLNFWDNWCFNIIEQKNLKEEKRIYKHTQQSKGPMVEHAWVIVHYYTKTKWASHSEYSYSTSLPFLLE